jgi:hypothetical protein
MRWTQSGSDGNLAVNTDLVQVFSTIVISERCLLGFIGWNLKAVKHIITQTGGVS